MTAKEFFKSTAFKCIAVLTCVLLVSGILLSIAWGFLEVTDEERFNRKIAVMYGGETVSSVAQDISGKNTSVDGATIQNLWFITEKNDYLVQAASRGYGGDITCWVTVSVDAATKKQVTGISKVIIYSVGDQAELVSNIPQSVYDKFSTDYADGKVFDYGTKGESEYIDVGASHSLSAVCNNVNGAVTFVKAFAGGGEIAKGEFDDFEYTALINTKSQTLKPKWTVNSGNVRYVINTNANHGPERFTLEITVDSTKTITAYAITKDGCVSDGENEKEFYQSKMHELAKNLVGKTLTDVESYLADERTDGGYLHTGATKSNESCYYAAAFALANYDRVIEIENAKGGMAQ